MPGARDEHLSVACNPVCDIYFGVGFLSKLMNLIQEVRNDYFSKCFFSIG